MKRLTLLFVIVVIAGLASCDDGKSLQKYYVENQEDSDFLALDLPANMFTNSASLEPEEKATLESIRKINVLALKKEEDPLKFEEEKSKLNEIFKNDKYQLLMKYGGGDRRAELYFTGEDDAIDELIVYGYDDEKGLGVARVLGENMNPEKFIKLLRSLDKENINVEGFNELGKFFENSGLEKKSVHDNNLNPGETKNTKIISDSI